ncbi:MAG TPA: peptidylprolyl isomerase, partial [Paracoccaceae bacterium]|nr:peptidylprolyl isomerase [Paracoccaceae bacterium]
AHALGLRPAPCEVAPGQWETDDDALIRQLLEALVTPEPADEAALRAIYDADPGRFRAPPLWEAAHILIPAAPGDARARKGAEALARQVTTEVRTSPDRFGALAAEHSACDSRKSGGLLGQIGPGDTVAEFEAALRRLPEGAITEEPVESPFGFHVIRLDARAEGAILPYPVVAPRLRAAAEKAAWVRAARAFTDRMAAEATVTGIALTAA